jgi:RNA polymerase sigma factor (sigma-70 family)
LDALATAPARRPRALRAQQPFQRFLDDHREPVLRLLRALVGPDEADDCFQETFIAALRAYDGMDGTHPRAWVMTIARRKAIDHHRARARRADVPEVAAASDTGDDDGAIRTAVAALPEGQRFAVALRYAADLPYREIGETLGCSEAAARRRVADALAALRTTVSRQEVRT